MSSNSKPFSTKLNCAILHIASRIFPLGFDVQGVDTDEIAPTTYEELCDRLDSGKRMVVASEGSEDTIFGDPEVNYAFRAWHDWTHWIGRHDFSLEGETATCEAQIALLEQFYQGSADLPLWSKLFRIEIIEQAKHYLATGEFVVQQRKFACKHLNATH